MAVDYDLIIFGATPAGIHAAIAAATLKARVALITQGVSPRHSPEAIPQQALLHLSHQIASSPLVTLPKKQAAGGSWQWAQLPQWLDAEVGNIEASRAETALAYRGVDVISNRGEFCRKPATGVVVGDRFLQARGYLLAMDTHPLIPAIAGLDTVSYLTPDQVPNYVISRTSEQTVIILGSGKTAVELAQTLTRFSIQPTIVTQHDSLLPTSDREVAQIIQAQLEADGVQIWLRTQIDQVRCLAGKKQLLTGKTVLSCDEIILAAGDTPNLDSLNLDAVSVQWDERGIPCQKTLKTSNPQIYACEGRVGWECFTSMATYEAAIALKNILFFPIHKVNVLNIPFAIQTMPEAAWIGLTADQAMQQYGSRNVYELRQSFSTLPKAQIGNDLTGFCKLIVHRNGTLLGAHLVGAQTSEFIGILALAMQQRLKIAAIANLSLPSPTLAEIVRQTANEYQQFQFKRALWKQDFVDHFFDFRRAWSRN